MNISFFNSFRFQSKKTLLHGIIIISIITFGFCSFGVPASAQAGAPDPVVVKAKKEILRIKQLVSTLKQGDKKTAKQYYDRLKQLEPGLKAVKNKKHPAWKEAAKAYNALLKRIVAIAKAKPAGQSQAPTPPEVVQALKDIARYETSAQKMPPGDKKLGRQYLNELAKIEKRLLAVKDRTHPQWKEAATRYVALQKRIVNTANANAKTAGGAPDPVVAAVMQDVKRYEDLAEAMQPGDKINAKKYLAELTAVGQKLKSAKNKAHPDWAEARKRYNALNNRIVAIAQKDPHAIEVEGLISSEQASLKRLNRSILTARNNIRKASLPKFQETSNINTYNNSITMFKRQHAKFQDQQHKGVVAVGRSITALEKLLAERIAASQKKLAGLGDMKSRLADIQTRFKATKVPQALKPPVDAQAAKAYVQKIRKLQKISKDDMAYIAQVEASGFAPKNVGSIKHWAGWERQKRLSDSLAQSIQRIDAHVERFMRSVAFGEQTDPRDKNHSSNWLLGKGNFEKMVQELKDGLAAVKTAAAFDKALGKTKAPDRPAQLKQLETGIKTYTEKYRLALNNMRMPKPAMTDKKYIAIAKEVLRNPKYKKINPHERLVINSKIRRKEKKEGDVQSGTVTTTVTIYHYVWDEYQVATAEKVGSEYYIYYSTIKFYHKGASTTPLQRWILSGRFQSSKILKENIQK